MLLGNNINFTAAKIPAISDLEKVQRAADCCLNGLYSKTISSVEQINKNFIKTNGPLKYVPNLTLTQKLYFAFRNFIGMPLDILNFIAKKFPDSKLYNSKILQNHRNFLQFESNVNSALGIQENTINYMKDYLPKGMQIQKGIKLDGEECSMECRSACSIIADKFYRYLNRAMDDDRATYDTKKKIRCANRIRFYGSLVFRE